MRGVNIIQLQIKQFLCALLSVLNRLRMATNINSLPVEVKMVILQSIGSYRDLISLLHASSILYRIYLLSPARCLHVSIIAEYPAGIVKGLVAVHHARV